MPTLKPLIVVIIQCFFAIGLCAKDSTSGNINIIKVANLEGLKAKHILKDRNGFMWFGTDIGLYRYDGYNTQLINSTSDGIHLSSNLIMALYEDREGNLWIGTDNGINKLSADRRSLKIYLAANTTSTPVKNNIRAITETHDGAIWCSFLNGNLYRSADKDHFKFVTRINFNVKGGFLPMITRLSEDREHHIWVGDDHNGYQKLSATGTVLQEYPKPQDQQWVVSYADQDNVLYADFKSVHAYSPIENKFIPVGPAKMQELLSDKLHYVYVDTKGLVWIMTDDKLLRLNQQTKKLDDLTEAYTRNGFSRFVIDCIYEDADHQIWIGTPFGVLRLENRENMFSTISIPKGVGKGTHFNVQGLLESGTGKILIGSYIGFFEYDTLSKKFEEFRLDKEGASWSNWYNTLVKALVYDTGKNLWMATDGNGLLYYNARTHSFKRTPILQKLQKGEETPVFIYSLIKDTDGLLWLGGSNNLYLFDPKTLKGQPYSWGKKGQAFSSLSIMAIHQSRDRSIWVGTNHGLFKIVKGRGITARYFSVPRSSKKAGLSNDFIYCIYEDKKGRLWVGTKGGGINVLDPENGAIEETYTVKEGLANNIVCAILPGKTEELWISTDNGLSRLDLGQKTFLNFHKNDGFPVNEFNVGAALSGADGKLYFGTQEGIVNFYPSKFKPQDSQSSVMLTKLLQHNGNTKEIQETTLTILSLNNISLSYKDQFFTVYFTLKNYIASADSRCQYAFKLDGIRDQWQNTGSLNYIQFAGLKAGKYMLRIKGMGSNGIWGKELQIPVLVGKAFYATNLAYVFYGLVLLSIIGAVYWSQINRIRLQNNLQLEHLQKEKLLELDEMKSRFFTNITHEFRTPLTLIISPVEELIMQPALPAVEEVRHQHNLIYRNAQRLLRLINQLLDSSKLEAGSMNLSESRGDLALFVERLIEYFRLQADKKTIRLNYSVFDLPSECLFDPEKIEKIVYNLLSNALKFTPQGGSIQVELSGITNPEAQKKICLRVSDTGIGISAQQLPLIFDRFHQVEDNRTRSFGGSGLGLFLVRELTSLLGGKVEAESREGEGTVFTLTLPLKDPVDSLPVVSMPVIPDTASDYTDAISIIPHPSDDKAPLVLVVEDHEDLRNFIARGLESKYRVISAQNGKEGWLLTQQELPDLVIADVAMPEMDGLNLSQLIKSTPLTTHIVVILLTARASFDNKMKGLSTGANDYLTKPFNMQELQLRVSNWLRHQRKLREHWQQKFLHQVLDEAPPPPAGLNVEDPFLLGINEVLDRELDNSAFTVDQLAREMMASTRTLHRKLSSLTGMNANELMRFYRLNKAADLLKKGHPVSNVAYMVGFEGLSYFAKCFKAQFSMSPSEYGLLQKDENSQQLN